MNAVVVAHGVSLGGSAGAREKLNEFWTEISRAGELYSPVRTLPWERWLQMYGFQADFSPTYHAFQFDDAPVLALSAQSLQLQSAEGRAAEGHRLRHARRTASGRRASS